MLRVSAVGAQLSQFGGSTVIVLSVQPAERPAEKQVATLVGVECRSRYTLISAQSRSKVIIVEVMVAERHSCLQPMDRRRISLDKPLQRVDTVGIVALHLSHSDIEISILIDRSRRLQTLQLRQLVDASRKILVVIHTDAPRQISVGTRRRCRILCRQHRSRRQAQHSQFMSSHNRFLTITQRYNKEMEENAK